ncbi:hypothetical protein PRIPAC_72371 [Pristionchus pacificus]|uniref:Acetyltransferase n=1 Tax=Pristionchus pacificus TaxID=54126 RepID=A0A2A6BG71_PRIPA|nr:hypothetical protein PRIPAC_72371 [Pristionchus pacificus]|eukprot:PDM64882.1 Acetyltransferase [Pristionchus pacificus]
MPLRQYSTLKELQELLNNEIDGEKRERPENNFVDNALRIAIAGEFTATELEVYGYPEADPQYLFFIEYSDVQYPYIHIRKPLSGHNLALLDEAVPLILEKVKHRLDKQGKLLVVGDEVTCDKFAFYLSKVTGDAYTTTTATVYCGVFYMTPEQREALMEEKSEPPAGFSFEPVNVDRDGETIHRLWKNGIDVEVTKNRIRYFPSICARTDEGEVVGWAMSARFGQVSNLFMMPEYRNRGAGRALEYSVAKEFARRGMRVFKYVETTNSSVYAGSLRSPLWTLWTEEDEDNNDTKKPNLHIFRRFERMVLIEWDSPESQQQLLDLLQKNGHGIPNNLVVDTAIRYSIEKRYPVSHMRYFSTEAAIGATPTYVFVFEENKTFSGFYARPPPSGHDEVLLQEALAELIDKFKHRLENDGEMQTLSDAFTRHVLHDILSSHFPSFYDVHPPSTVQVFYMTDEQMRKVEEMELKPIEGYYADSVDLKRDAKRINENWLHSDCLESTTARLHHLPACVVRDSSTGEAVAWDMSSPFGQCSNLFTIPAYRGKGLAVLAQMHLVKSFVNQGLRPFKYVEISNWNLIEATRRHPLWTRWEDENKSMKQLEGPVVYHPMFFTTIKKKE